MFYRRLSRVLPVVVATLSVGHSGCVAVVADEVRSECVAGRSVSMSEGAAAGTSAPKVVISNGLLLYYDRFSFYSQKVVMALHEKNLPFDSKIINLVKSDQYQSWFLSLNPRGEVPVLQDTGKIIPDSARIIDYLEDNFSNGDTPRLIPMDQGPEVRQRVTHFRHILQKAPEGSLTTGAMLHQDMLQNPKTPFFAPVRRALASAAKNSATKLREYAEKNPEAKEILLKKATDSEESYKRLLVTENFEQVLTEIHKILDEVENELSGHTGDKQDWWLCSRSFTIADVELAVLLVRISQLGLEHIFWTAGKKSHIEQYYGRVQQRESYKKSFPGTFTLLKTIFFGHSPLMAGVVAAVALVIGGVLLARKYIS